jgi:hypothetical protein
MELNGGGPPKPSTDADPAARGSQLESGCKAISCSQNAVSTETKIPNNVSRINLVSTLGVDLALPRLDSGSRDPASGKCRGRRGRGPFGVQWSTRELCRRLSRRLLIRGTGGFRKVRVARKGMGKSGGPGLCISGATLTRGDMAKLRKYSEEIEAWKKGAQRSHLKR